MADAEMARSAQVSNQLHLALGLAISINEPFFASRRGHTQRPWSY